jgi:hypothetical protein
MSLTYTEFIKKVGYSEFVKCLNNKYNIGLNEDKNSLNPFNSCKRCGLYFTTKEHVNKFLEYGLNIALLELCEDAEFYIEQYGTKFKTNKFIIKEILPQTEELCMLAVKQK